MVRIERVAAVRIFAAAPHRTPIADRRDADARPDARLPQLTGRLSRRRGAQASASRRPRPRTRSSVAVNATRTCCAPGGAVELPRRHQDPALGEPARRCPSTARRGSPTGRATPPSGRSGSRPPRAPPAARYAGRVARVLLGDVLVVVEGRLHRHLLRPGHLQPEVLAHREQLADHGGVAGHERAPVAGQVGPLRQRVHREDAGRVAVADVGVQHADRRSAGSHQAHSR